jgi:PAS domain S-box-containing protein
MDFLFFDDVQKKPYFIPAFIAVSSIAFFLLNIYGLKSGITSVLPHLFYLPIIVTAYYYPRRGVLFAFCLSLCYCVISGTVISPTPDDMVSAIARSCFFIMVAWVVSYLSEQMHHDTEICRRLASVVDSSGEAIIGETNDGVISDWNTGAEHIYGYTSREMVGNSIDRLILPERREELHRLLEKIWQGKTVERSETERITKDGRRIQVSFALSPILNSVGDIIGISEISNDITERQRFQNEILKAKNQWELTFNAVPDLIAIIDNHYRIVQVNKAMADRLGVSPEHAVGLTCYEVVHHTTNPPAICPHQLLLGDGQRHSTDIHENNLHGDFYLTVSPIRDPSGAILGSVHILHDITERKRAEDALALASRKLNLLSSITRHDILNQLMALKTYIELSKDELDKGTLAKYISTEGKIADTLERQIDFTREYQDLGVTAPVWQNVHASIEKAVVELPLRNISVKIDLPDCEVFADPLIAKVFYNLIDNAVKYGGKITTIRFSAQESGDNHLIICEDDGNGIPSDEKEQIFDRGFGKNTGLGLFLSREILSITGITIRENGEPGKGARFEIVMPKGYYRIRGEV